MYLFHVPHDLSAICCASDWSVCLDSLLQRQWAMPGTNEVVKFFIDSDGHLQELEEKKTEVLTQGLL